MMKKFKRAIKRRLRPAWDKRLAGDAARNARDWGTAAQAYGDYLARNPNDWAIWVQCGHARRESGDMAGAEQAYRRANDIDRDQVDPLFQLGALMKRLGRREEAIDFYRRSAALGLDAGISELAMLGINYKPAVPVASLLRTLLDAQAARDLHRWAEAEKLYLAYLQRVPESGQAKTELDALRQAARS